MNIAYQKPYQKHKKKLKLSESKVSIKVVRRIEYKLEEKR